MKSTKSPRTTIIESRGRLLSLRLQELIHSKDLIKILIRRDFLVTYKQTVLGPLWFIVQPMLATMMYVFIFGRIARLSTDQIPQPLFYFIGTMVWSFFSVCLQKTSDTFVSNVTLFGRIYFPRLAVPISYVSTALITFGIQFGIVLIIILYYALKGFAIELTFLALMLPVLVVQVAALGVGAGLIVSAVTTKYRDLRTLVAFGLSLWMYATPVLYPMSAVPHRFKIILALNPMSSVMELFRASFLGLTFTSWDTWFGSVAVSLVLLVSGIVVFNRNERTFIDVI